MWLLLPFAIFGGWALFTKIQAKSHHETIGDAIHHQKIGLMHFLHIGAAEDPVTAMTHAQASLAAIQIAAGKIVEAAQQSGTDAQKATTVAAKQVIDGTTDLIAAAQLLAHAQAEADKAAAYDAIAAANEKIAAGQHALAAAGVQV